MYSSMCKEFGSIAQWSQISSLFIQAHYKCVGMHAQHVIINSACNDKHHNYTIEF